MHVPGRRPTWRRTWPWTAPSADTGSWCRLLQGLQGRKHLSQKERSKWREWDRDIDCVHCDMSPLASHHRESRYDSHLRSVCARARTRYRQIERRVTQVAVSRYGGAPKRAVPGEGKGTGCFTFMCEWRESGCCDGYCTCWYARKMNETVTAVALFCTCFLVFSEL